MEQNALTMTIIGESTIYNDVDRHAGNNEFTIRKCILIKVFAHSFKILLNINNFHVHKIIAIKQQIMIYMGDLRRKMNNFLLL